eukprot:CAMPEP_0175435652 /NCGR_PEP_ID=MMETSP0095-20121207/54535_1 /TAXON_ID=311494 /ORGANISM="Alexandrium monilatum, Strain CCMP3105" /LENGTH=118 /DNA_ID=CAMNT_0016735241 /DNA_START=68 /DNA_END=422 /DNA_ORIENTATION=+
MPHARRPPRGEAEDLGARLDHVQGVLPLEPQVRGRPRKVQAPARVLQSPAPRVEAVRVERPADLARDVLHHLGTAWWVPRVLARAPAWCACALGEKAVSRFRNIGMSGPPKPELEKLA